jgi:phenylpyruvate tautomerase PptA (4-oxalocrotonate tautomerase family)
VAIADSIIDGRNKRTKSEYKRRVFRNTKAKLVKGQTEIMLTYLFLEKLRQIIQILVLLVDINKRHWGTTVQEVHAVFLVYR